MNDKLNINLRIAGVNLSLAINRSEEQQLRHVAREVNHAYDAYKSRFAGSTPMEVLAKVTLLFAQGYLSLTAQSKELDTELEAFERELTRMIEGNDPSQKSDPDVRK